MHTLSKIDSYFSTYQTGVFSWQPHTFLQESVKQTMVWASQQLFWNIQPSSFLLNKMWWLFVVNVILGQIHQTFGDYLSWNDILWLQYLQRILNTGDHSQHTNPFFTVSQNGLDWKESQRSSSSNYPAVGRVVNH